MTTVAEELPFAAVVYDGKLSTTCSNCFASDLGGHLEKSVDFKKCARCHTIYYCCKECQRKDWKHHKNECTFLINAKHCPETYVRFVSRTAMRIRKGDLPVAFNGRTFDDLMDHADDIIAHELGHRYIIMLYLNLVRFMGAENAPSKEEVLSIYGKLRINSMVISSYDLIETVGYGLYLGLSVHDHSCRPDCFFISYGSKKILRAKDPHAKYSTALLLPKKIRQLRLQKSHFFVCQCARCMDEKEDLWERSGRSSCCADGVVLPSDNGKPLVCSKCGKESSLTTPGEINNANELALPYLDDDERKDKLIEKNTAIGRATGEVDVFKNCYTRMNAILSPYNLYFATISEVVCDILSDLNFIDERESIRFLRAEEKVIERYAPFTPKMIITKFRIYKCEKELLDKESTKYQFDKFIDAGKKFCAVAEEVCGPEHPFTKDIQQGVKNDEEIYKYLKLRH